MCSAWIDYVAVRSRGKHSSNSTDLYDLYDSSFVNCLLERRMYLALFPSFLTEQDAEMMTYMARIPYVSRAVVSQSGTAAFGSTFNRSSLMAGRRPMVVCGMAVFAYGTATLIPPIPSYLGLGFNFSGSKIRM